MGGGWGYNPKKCSLFHNYLQIIGKTLLSSRSKFIFNIQAKYHQKWQFKKWVTLLKMSFYIKIKVRIHVQISVILRGYIFITAQKKKYSSGTDRNPAYWATKKYHITWEAFFKTLVSNIVGKKVLQKINLLLAKIFKPFFLSKRKKKHFKNLRFFF